MVNNAFPWFAQLTSQPVYHLTKFRVDPIDRVGSKFETKVWNLIPRNHMSQIRQMTLIPLSLTCQHRLILGAQKGEENECYYP